MPGLACLDRLRNWSEIKEQPSMWLHNSCSCTTSKQSALRKGTALCGCWYDRWRTPVCVQLATKRHMVFSAAQLKTRLLSALSFQKLCGLSMASKLHEHSKCCFYFPTLTWEAIYWYLPFTAWACSLVHRHGHGSHGRAAKGLLIAQFNSTGTSTCNTQLPKSHVIDLQCENPTCSRTYGHPLQSPLTGNTFGITSPDRQYLWWLCEGQRSRFATWRWHILTFGPCGMICENSFTMCRRASIQQDVEDCSLPSSASKSELQRFR